MRADLEVVAELIDPGAHVLDLGCGDGELLAQLAVDKGCTGTGVDVEPSALVAAISRGVSVIELDVDHQLDQFADGSYDVVVVSQTLQATRHPGEILGELRRIAGRGIVSVPNFALWKHRAALLFTGRMPVSTSLPHPWYATPNIHLATLRDLEDLIKAEGFTVRRRVLLDSHGQAAARSAKRAPNLLAAGAAYLIESSASGEVLSTRHLGDGS